MRPEGMSAKDAADTLAKIRAEVIERETAIGGIMSGDRVTEAVRQKWCQLCGTEFVPQWKLNGMTEPPVTPVAFTAKPPVVTQTEEPKPTEEPAPKPRKRRGP